jgi:hypothetical protein
VTLLNFWVVVPDGDVAPVKTAVEPLSSRSAIDWGVVTSPRMSIVVSRLGRYAIPPGARTLLACTALTTSLAV